MLGEATGSERRLRDVPLRIDALRVNDDGKCFWPSTHFFVPRQASQAKQLCNGWSANMPTAHRFWYNLGLRARRRRVWAKSEQPKAPADGGADSCVALFLKPVK